MSEGTRHTRQIASLGRARVLGTEAFTSSCKIFPSSPNLSNEKIERSVKILIGGERKKKFSKFSRARTMNNLKNRVRVSSVNCASLLNDGSRRSLCLRRSHRRRCHDDSDNCDGSSGGNDVYDDDNDVTDDGCH